MSVTENIFLPFHLCIISLPIDERPSHKSPTAAFYFSHPSKKKRNLQLKNSSCFVYCASTHRHGGREGSTQQMDRHLSAMTTSKICFLKQMSFCFVHQQTNLPYLSQICRL